MASRSWIFYEERTWMGIFKQEIGIVIQNKGVLVIALLT